MQKIGVFVCWCGSNIAATVDVKAVAEALEIASRASSSATDYQYMCSENGQNLIQQRHPRACARRRGGVLLLAAYARGDLPQDGACSPA